MHALTVIVSGPEFTNFLFNSRVFLLNNAIVLLSISLSAPEIFAVKVKSCPASHRILYVLRFPKF